ncbi:hypothetical protein, partial [Nodularia sp. UHCC 0506]|uniref:hypothetical protein n=1 Tax=Nodularia sp. UHCC 0506 TaxID=3110243 RepID=UPI002B1F2BE3
QIPSEEEISDLIEQDAFKRNMNLGEFPGGFGGTDFAKYVLEFRVLDRYNLQSVGNDYQLIYNWFIKSVSELGYPGFNEQCYKYDRYLIGKYGGGRGRETWAERLGKKYYWILLHRLAGILADHFPRKIDSWENETSLPRLQGIELRDIDPTDLRVFYPQIEINTEWYQPINYDFDITKNLSHDKWAELKDFPNLTEIVGVTDKQGKKWFHLSLSSSLEKVSSNENNTKYPHRNLRTLINTAFVPYSDIENIKKELSNNNFPENLMIPHDNKLLILEYPNTVTCHQRFETRKIDLECEIPGTENAELTRIQILRGNEWEYDCSQDEYSENINVPVPDLVNFGNLKWDGQSSWLDEFKTIQVTEISTGSGFGLLIKGDYLKNFLQASSLALIFIGFQEKFVINKQFSGASSIHGLRTVYIFDGQNIINAYQIHKTIT